jgi:hypothetical protein
MKRNSLGTLSLVVFSLMFTAGARAQAMEEANVPFAFQAGSVQLPAGHYLIKEDHLRASIRIRNLNTGATADIPVRQSSFGAVKGALVFRNVGNQHFLAEVCGSEDSLNLTLSPCPLNNRRCSYLPTLFVGRYGWDVYTQLAPQ